MTVKRVAGLLLAAGLTLAACGSDGSDATDTGSDDAMSDEEMVEDEMTENEMTEEEMEDDEMMGDPVSFVVTVTNVSDSAATPTPLAPGVAFAHHGPSPIAEEMYHGQLESLAEDGDPGGFADIDGAVVFNTPDGASEPGVAAPGGSYSFTVEGVPGDALTFATMFVQSNDWFFSVEELALFDADSNPLEGDITSELDLLDAGTEVDQEPGSGADQAPRQAGPDTGAADPDTSIRSVADRDAGDYVTVTISLG